MDRNQFYIAALLHDIGKMLERSKQFAIDPVFRQESKYGHEAVSAQFIANYIGKHPLCTNEVRDLIWQHHRNDVADVYAKLLQIADWLSSGERRQITTGSEASEYNKTPLTSIFASLFDRNDIWTYGLDALNSDKKTLFPQKGQIAIGTEDYRKLSDDFCKEFSQIKFDYQLYSMLEKYTWAVPSSTPNIKSQTKADISLFDHSRTTAAIALCLYDQYQSGLFTKEIIFKITPNNLDDSKQFLLVNGDFSGVQDFIFNVSSKGAAKSLKGRSFYLDLLSEVISNFIVNELNLKQANIIYNGGGNFYLLIPAEKQTKLSEIYSYCSRLLFNAHQGKLYLALGTLQLTMTDFILNNNLNEKTGFSDKWRRVGENTNHNKMLRYKEFNFASVFDPFEGGGGEECPVCNCETEKQQMRMTSHDKNEHACPMCYSFIQLTKDIKSASYINMKPLEKTIDRERTSFSFHDGYTDVFRFLGINLGINEKNFIDRFDIKLNDTGFLPGSGFRFSAVKNSNDSFDELAKASKGAQKLALLKMDVDNLGNLFRSGLAPEYNTISRIAAISRELRLFFEGYLQTILEQEKYSKKIYAIYAGGDDTFLAGAWNSVLELAADIRNQFSEFVCKHPNISLSAGIVVVDEKFPIIRSAELVEQALVKSKNYKHNEKDKICLFDNVFSWDEFYYIKEIKEILIKLIEKKGESRSILNKVMKSTIGFEKLMQSAGKGSLKTEKVWRFAYYIGRSKHHTEKYKETDAIYDELVKIYEKIILERMFNNKVIENIMILPAACRWAELETRKKNKKQEDK